MTTANTEILQHVLDRANPSQLGAALQQVRLGTILTPLKRTFAGLTAAAAFDLTAIDASGEDAGAANAKRIPALSITTLRVTGGAAAAGDRQVSDVGGTPSTTVATLSDDGKTITFEANVTDFVITYVPRSYTDMGAGYASE